MTYCFNARADTTSYQVYLKCLDNTTGLPKTDVVYNSAGIDLWYRREGATKTSITEATLAALTTAWTSGGFLHIGDGVYRLDIPDAALANGVRSCAYGGTVTGGLFIGGMINLTTETAADVATAILDRATSGHVTAGTVGKAIVDILDDTGTSGVAIGDGTLTAAKFASAFLTAVKLGSDAITAIQAGLATAAAVAAAQTDIDDVQSRLPAALVNGRMPADIQRMNAAEVAGAGTSGNKWRGV